jgi:hypothetical protein
MMVRENFDPNNSERLPAGCRFSCAESRKRQIDAYL